MAVPVIASGDTYLSGTHFFSFSKPSGLAVGDLMTLDAFLAASTSGTPSMPSGWTIGATVAWDASWQVQRYFAYKVADAADVAASTFDFDSNATVKYGAFGVFKRITGAHPTTPINGTPAGQQATTGAIGTFSSVTTTVDDCLVMISAGLSYSSGTASGSEFPNVMPSGVTGSTSIIDDPGSTYLGTGYFAQSAAGATGSKTVAVKALAVAGIFQSITVAIAPANTPIVASATGVFAGSTNQIVFSKPSGLAVGDLIVVEMAVAADAPATPTLASGFTIPSGATTAWQSATSIQCYVAYKVATSGDVAASTFTFDTAAGPTKYAAFGVIKRITNAHRTNPINGAPTSQIVTSGTTGTFPSVTTTLSNCLILLSAAETLPSTPSGSEFPNIAPSGTTLSASAADAPNFVYFGTAYYIQGPAGATGAKTVAVPNLAGFDFQAITVAIAPRTGDDNADTIAAGPVFWPSLNAKTWAYGSLLSITGWFDRLLVEAPTTGGPTTYYVNLQAVSTPSPAIARTNTRRLQAFSTPAVGLQRTLSRPLQAVTTPVPSRRSTISRALQASSTAVAAVARLVQQRVQAQSTPTPTLQRQISRAFQAVTTPLAAVARTIALSRQAQSTPTPAESHGSFKNISVQATTTPIPSRSQGLSKTVSVQAQTTPAVNMQRTTSRRVQALTTPAVSVSRLVTRLFQALMTPLPTVRRTVTKPVQSISTPVPAAQRLLSIVRQAFSTPTPSESHGLSKNVFVQAATTPAVNLRRTTSRNIQAVSTPAVSISRLVSRFFQAVSTPAPTARRTVSKALQAATTPNPLAQRLLSAFVQAVSTPAPTVGRAQAKSFQAVTTPVPSVNRVVSRLIQAFTTPLPRVSRSLSKSLQATTTPEPAQRRTLSRTFQAVITPAPTYEGIKSKIVLVQAETIPLAALARTVALQRQAVTTPLPSVRRTVARTLIASAGVVASCAKVIGRNLQASSTPRPSIGRLIFKGLQAVMTPLPRMVKTGGSALPPKMRIFTILFHRRPPS